MNGLFNCDFYLYLRYENDTRLDDKTDLRFSLLNIGRFVFYGVESQHTRVISTFNFAPDTTGYPLDVQHLGEFFDLAAPILCLTYYYSQHYF